MKVFTKARLALGAAALAGLLVYLAIVELGVNAGRVHYGVNVVGFDIGGLTELDAAEALRRRKAVLENVPVTFIAHGFFCTTLPTELGWSPQPFNTVQDAMEVGREGLVDGLRDRLAAWFGGYKVGWAGTVDPSRVDAFLDECEESARVVNATVDRGKLRFRIRRAIVTYPRGSLDFKVPLIRKPS